MKQEAFRAMALVSLAGILGTGRGTPPVLAEALSQPVRNVELTQDEPRKTLAVNFQNWPRVADRNGCSEGYTDPQTGQYHMVVRCPDFTSRRLIDSSFLDFDFEMDIAKPIVRDVLYGAVAIENRGTPYETSHLFLLDGQGALLYRKVGFNNNLERYIKTQSSYDIGVAEENAHERIGVAREEKRMQAFYNGIELFDEERFTRSGSEIRLGFIVLTSSEFGPDDRVDVAFQRAVIHAPIIRERNNPRNRMVIV